MTPEWQRRFLGVFLLFAVMRYSATAQETAPQTTDNKSVQVFLTVTSKNNSSAGTLSLSDLSVFIDKQPAKAVSLRSAKADPLLFALLVDISSSRAKQADTIRETAEKIFETLSSRGDRGYLVFFENHVLLSKAPLQASSARAALDSVKFGGGTALFDAIGQTCTQLLARSANPDAPRRAILLLSDGDDNQSRMTLSDVDKDAEEQGVAIFALSGSASSIGEHVLMEASQKTGGQSVISTSLGDGAEPLLAAIDGQLILTLLPPGASDQRLHSLLIKSAQKGVRVSVPSQITLQ